MLTWLSKFPLWQPLRKRAFRLLWIGEGFSLLADQAFIVALTLLVARITGAGVELGAVLAVAAVPGAILTPLGGALTDRFSPAPLMLVANVGRVVLLAALAGLVLLDAVQLWHLYVLGGLLSVLDALYYPASLSIVPVLVEEKGLPAANALVQGAEQVSGMVGPALAAFSVAALGLGVTFGFGAALFAVAALAFVFVLRATRRGKAARVTKESVPAIRGPAKPTGAGSLPAGAEPNVGGVGLAGIWEGVRYAWGDPVIRAMLLILAAINLAAIGPVVVGGVALAELRLGGAGAFGVLLSAFGAGSLVGALGTGSIRNPRHRGLALLAVACILGLGLGALGFVPGLLLSSVTAAVMGVGAGYLGVVLVAWLQERVEPGVRGRVMGLVVFAVIALDPVSYALAGALLEFGPEVLFATAGTFLLLVTILFGAASRTVRNFD